MIGLELFVRHGGKLIQSQPVAPILPVCFCNVHQALFEYLIPLHLLLWAGVDLAVLDRSRCKKDQEVCLALRDPPASIGQQRGLGGWQKQNKLQKLGT
jgi:hypothetical protein